MKTCLERVPKKGVWGAHLGPSRLLAVRLLQIFREGGRPVLEIWGVKTERVLERARDPACWGILMAPREPALHSFTQDVSGISCMKDMRLGPLCETQAQ